MSTDAPAGTYAAFRLSKEAETQLHNFVAQNMPKIVELELPEEYHITLTYSRQTIDYVPQEHEPALATPVKYEYLGRPDSDPVLVLRVDHPLLYNRHNYAMVLGATHDFPDYLPHITLTKKVPGRVVDLKSLELPPFNIELGEEYTTALRKEDFEQEGELL